MTNTRQDAPRKAISLLVKLADKGVDEFTQKYATDLSKGGMFIRSRQPKPVGTVIAFKVEIANGERVLQGKGTVQWAREEGDPKGPAGMGLKFTELDAASQALIQRLLAPPPAAEEEMVIEDEPLGAPGSAPTLDIPKANADRSVDLDLDLLMASTPEPAAPAPAPAAAAPTGGGYSFSDLDLELEPAPGETAPPPAAPSPAARAAPAAASVAPAPAAAAAPAPASVERKPDNLFDGIDFAGGDDDAPLELDDRRPSRAPPPAAAKPQKAPPPKVPDPPLPEIRRGPAPAQPQAARGPEQLKPKAEIAPPPAAAHAPGSTVFLKPPATIEAKGPVIGIDLGTTNSCIAVLANGKPRVLRSKDGYNTVPSVVSLSNKGILSVGHRAKSQILLNPQNTIYGAKRLVGRDYNSPTVQAVRERFRYEVVAGPDGKAAVTLGQHILTLEEVQGLVLKEMKEFAEQYLGQAVNRAVVTCPAYYSEQQREAVRKAGALAGLKVERVLNEPTAAALAYGMNRELSKKVMVFDLGGGTFDATILRIDKNVFEVLATGGDVFLGGLDFDNLIVDVLLTKFMQANNCEFSGDPVALSRVTDQAERAKLALSEAQNFEVHLPMLQMAADGKPLDLRCTITRAELNTICEPLVNRTAEVVADVLLDAKLKRTDIDDVILVGGMTRMPLVRQKIEAWFKKSPQASVNADEAVALGAAIYTGTVEKVSSITLIDVVPMTIGVGMGGGAFKRMIERNTPLPASHSFTVSTTKDNETAIEVNVFQGEDQNVLGNEYVGTVRIEGLPSLPKGLVQVVVSLNLDAECVLLVEARELKTRKTFSTSLATRYTPDQIRQRLGVKQQGPSQAETARAEELKARGGSFWGRLKRVFGKK